MSDFLYLIKYIVKTVNMMKYVSVCMYLQMKKASPKLLANCPIREVG